jgi:hypothetical protein
MTIKKFLANWWIHVLLLWLLLNGWFSFIYFYKGQLWGLYTLNKDGSPVTIMQQLAEHNLHSLDYLFLVPFVLLVELNYWFVFKKRHVVFFILGAKITAVVAVFFTQFINVDGAQNKFPHDYLEPALAFFAYAIGYGLAREFVYQRLYSMKVRLKVSETELHLLKQQLNPHFLFNTLNYLYGTALRENASRTAEGIDMMSGMMRYSVTGMQENFMPLADELEFIRNYFSLQQLRQLSGDQHKIELGIKTDNKPSKIAPMLLIPFVENAFKYGISTEKESFIRVLITVENGQLKMEVDNSITASIQTRGTNTGLELTRKRLDLLYKGKHSLETQNTGNAFSVKLNLQLN